MEIPDGLADSCKSYVSDVQRLVPVGQIIVGAFAFIFIVTARHEASTENGIWLPLLGVNFQALSDKENWKALKGVDFMVVLFAICLGSVIFSIFQRLVFWAITSSHGFKFFISGQRTKLIDSKLERKEKIEWLKFRIEKEMLPVRRLNLVSEVLCGIVAITLTLGSFTATVDLVFIGCLLLVSYIFIQSAAKEYVRTAFPLTLTLSNLSGFSETPPSSSM